MKIPKKVIIPISCILFLSIAVFIWLKLGMPGGYIPGYYDPERKMYIVHFTGAKLRVLGRDRMEGVTRETFKSTSIDGYCLIALKLPKQTLGYIDITGRVVIPIKYDDITVMSMKPQALFRVTKKGKQGVVNISNKTIVPVKYEKIGIVSHSGQTALIALKEGQSFMFDTLGNNIATIKGRLSNKQKNLVIFSQDSTRLIHPSVYDLSGKEVLKEGVFDFINLKSPGHFASFFIARKNNMEPYAVNANTYEYKPIDFFINNSASAFNDKMVISTALYVDSLQGQEIDWWSSDFTWGAKSFSYGNKHFPTKYGLLTSSGEVKLPFIYDKIEEWENFGLLVSGKGLYGLLNKEGNKWLLPLSPNKPAKLYLAHNLIEVQNLNNYSKFYIDSKTGVVILSGKVRNVEFLYNEENYNSLVFISKGIKYKMYYDNEKEKFIWYSI